MGGAGTGVGAAAGVGQRRARTVRRAANAAPRGRLAASALLPLAASALLPLAARALLPLAALAAGCAAGGEAAGRAPALSLRDVLSMEPEEVVALPLETRLALRDDFALAMLEQRAAERVGDDGTDDSPALVARWDAARAARDEEAIAAVATRRAEAPALEPSATLRTLPAEGGDGGVARAPHVDFLVEDPDALLDDAMRRAIDGPARPWLERMAADVGAAVLAPAPGAAAAIVGDEARVFVSPSWLALLASLAEVEDVRTGSAALVYGPVGHHDTSSSGFGCYESCTCSCGSYSFFGGGSTPSSCDCNYCGFDWGLCASECGPEGEGCHCRAARPRPRRGGSPLDPVWIAAPAAYLVLRRRRR